MHRYIGLMSGTSMDAIDCVLVEFSQTLPQVLATSQTPIAEDIRLRLQSLCQGGGSELDELAALDHVMGRLFAQEVLQLLAQTAVETRDVRAIGSHGQTIRHYPPRQGRGNSLQIGDPNLIAALTGICTIADFRRKDMAVGGQGAPLVPAFHNAVFRREDKGRVVVNIGGIANLTILPRDPAAQVTGFDSGPGNLLMDAWIHRHLGKNLDEDGAWAASGAAHGPLLTALLQDAYFKNPPPKSTGREYFNLEWLEPLIAAHAPAADPVDIQATLCELTAQSISHAIFQHASHCEEVLLCGGGIHNKYLLQRLSTLLAPRTLHSTHDFGIAPDFVEAIAFAWLARQTLEGKPGNLPSVTGAERAVILGGVYS